MAKKTITLVELTDDLDGSKAERTVSFSFDGKGYEIDLSKRNASAFEKLMAPYVQSARPSQTRARTASRRGRTAAAASNKADLQAMRDWARENGFEVSDRGRIASSVQDAYRAAH